MSDLAGRLRYGIVAGAAAALLLALAAAGGAADRAHAQTDCISAIDLMLVLDGSESIVPQDFETMRSFVKDLLGQFAIGPEDAHAGIVQFAGEGQGRIEIGLSGDAAAVQAAVASMTQIIGATDIQEGIAYGQGELALGARGMPQVMIVMTDGAHNQPGDPVGEALAAREAGTEIFAIAVGTGPDQEQLAAIAGDAAGVFSVESYAALVTILEPLVRVVCPPEPTPTPVDSSVPFDPEPEPESEVLPLTLPATGHHDLPADWAERGRPLMAQAAIGLGAALVLLGAAWWLRSRAGRRR